MTVGPNVALFFLILASFLSYDNLFSVSDSNVQCNTCSRFMLMKVGYAGREKTFLPDHPTLSLSPLPLPRLLSILVVLSSLDIVLCMWY